MTGNQLQQARFAFIGAGQMAQALARGFVKQGGVPPHHIIAADRMEDARQRFQAQIPGSKMAADNQAAADQSDVIILATKPQQVLDVCTQLAPKASAQLVVSIAAGISLAQLSQAIQSQRVIRVMPNTPCLVGRGAAGFSPGTDATETDRQLIAALLSTVGLAFELPEPALDAVTGLSGSGPAFVYQFIEALSDGGVREGLPREVAQRLAAQTVLGAAEMVLQTRQHPAILRDQVASPGGTTIAGLAALAERAFAGTVMAAVQAASTRSRELGSPPAKNVDND